VVQKVQRCKGLHLGLILRLHKDDRYYDEDCYHHRQPRKPWSSGV